MSETLMPAASMDPNQKLALDLWLESANLFNDFKPLTDRELCEKMAERGVEVGKSTVDRWRKKFNFEGFLQMKISASIVEDAETREMIEKSSIDVAVKKTTVDVQRNGELTSMAYEILELKMKLIKKEYEATQSISLDNAKFAKDVATLTAGREDKLLDRAALMGAAELLKADDIRAALRETVIEIDDGTDIYDEKEDFE